MQRGAADRLVDARQELFQAPIPRRRRRRRSWRDVRDVLSRGAELSKIWRAAREHAARICRNAQPKIATSGIRSWREHPSQKSRKRPDSSQRIFRKFSGRKCLRPLYNKSEGIKYVTSIQSLRKEERIRAKPRAGRVDLAVFRVI